MSDWGARLKKVEQLARSFHRNPLASPYKPRLGPSQPSSVWRFFPRQNLAISFAHSCKEAVHVFALEKEQWPQGQRIYLVTSYTELWHYYKKYTKSLMHCYEVIPEGTVCKLYFDLEFHKLSNKEADGKAMVMSLVQYVCDKLMEVYGVQCATDDVVNLDSSTDDKFSRHLIFNLQNAAFKDNTHVGRFTHAILQPVLSKLKRTWDLHSGMDSAAENSETRSPEAKRWKPGERDLAFLQVKNKDGQDCLFVDLGVYTKNRNFRLYKSSKVGKNVAFTLAEDNTFIAAPIKGKSAEESVFLASLICNVSFTNQRILTWDTPEAKEEKQPKLHAVSHSNSLSSSLSSPYKEVDDFVVTLVKKDGIEGSIRRWNYFATEQLIVYDIANFRWCENVQRFHKSNNIMIIVDLKAEVWYQKCHDLECKNFRSSSYPLPQEICVSYIMSMDDEDQTYFMDDHGNIEPSQTLKAVPKSPECLEKDCCADVWGDGGQDDQELMESLEDFEQRREEISDQLLLQCATEFDSQ